MYMHAEVYSGWCFINLHLIVCCVFHVSVNLSLIGLCSVGHTIYGLASMFIIVEFIATNLISITDGQLIFLTFLVEVISLHYLYSCWINLPMFSVLSVNSWL